MFCSRRGFKTESRGNDEKQHQEKIRTEKKIKESANLRQSSGLALRIREKLSTQGGLPLNERTSAHGNGKRRQNRRAKTRSRKTHPDFFPTSRRSLHENFPSLRKNRTKHGKNHSHAPRNRIKTRNPFPRLAQKIPRKQVHWRAQHSVTMVSCTESRIFNRKKKEAFFQMLLLKAF